MKMDVRKSTLYSADAYDEGDLSSSLENLSSPPRLRGELRLSVNSLTGWLIDARHPSAGLQLTLVVDGRKTVSTTTAKPKRRTASLDQTDRQFVLSAPQVDVSKAASLELHVKCPGGEQYVLLIASSEGEDGQIEQHGKITELDCDLERTNAQRPALQAQAVSGAEVDSEMEVSKREQTAHGINRSAKVTNEKQPSPANQHSQQIKGETYGTQVKEGNAPTAKSKSDPNVKDGKSHVRAYVDALYPSMIAGWAWDERNPNATIEILVLHKQSEVMGGPAANLRQDLKDHGVGTGLYGFNFPLPTCDPRDIVVQAKFGALVENVEIPAHFLQNLPSKASSSIVRSSDKQAFEGHIDLLTRWGAVGWAWLPQLPNEQAVVEAVHGGTVIGRTVANRLREDLAAHGKGTGLYGFELAFDQPIKNDVIPEFRVLQPSTGCLDNSNPLPARSENERQLQGRGNIEDFYAEQAKYASAGEAFEEFDPTILQQIDRSKLDLIAFYLPQFHPIKENDRFWGKGFTEWRQLSRGLPRYRGHYQPRTPRDLGFYTLTNVEPITRQAALAKAAGINVFGFYYYWFNRTRVLDEPVEIFLRSGVEMKFMLIWANENWTRTWDGSESSILLKQDYNEDEEKALIADWARHFQDQRYYRIDGRPLFVIYNPKLVPDSQKTIARWRRILQIDHDMNPLMFMAQTFGMRDPSDFGLDGAIEFPPHKLSDTLPGRPTPDAYSPNFAGRVIEYGDFVKVSLAEEAHAYPLIKTVVPSWDNEARRPNRGLSLEQSTPQKYEMWLSGLIQSALSAPPIGGGKGRAVVAVNAWNEWAEGAYLEPDVHFGAAYLNATARAICNSVKSVKSLASAQREPEPAVSVIFPNYNHAKYLPERISSVLQQTMKPAEIIFLDDCSSDNSIEVARGLLQKCNIPYKIIPNKQNSGNVFKQWMKGLEEASSDWIWIAETDDSADHGFLEYLSPMLQREDVLAAYGMISFINGAGKRSNDLAGYYDGLQLFDWQRSTVVTAKKAFEYDFVVKNIIPNASGVVFKKPVLTEAQKERLFQYKFAGDWYFYALLLRGGKIGYCRDARSYFRVSLESTSRSAFFTDRHLAEHQMVVEDLRDLYRVEEAAVAAHAGALATHFPAKPLVEVIKLFEKKPKAAGMGRPLRICIAAHSFETGGGELLPVTLANTLRELDHHVTYLVMEKERCRSNLRSRLRPDVSVVYWQDVQDKFDSFLDEHGIEIFNSHNVSVEYQLFCRDVKVGRPYIASLHGGYETVADLLKGPFAKYLSSTVSKWLFLADKNVKILTDHGIERRSFEKSFNAVPQFEGPFERREELVKANGIDPSAFIFVQCSRAIREKGWREAALAMQEASKAAGRPLHLVLIGDGPDLAELREEFVNEKRVSFMGHIDNPVRYFRCFDAAIFPSYFKGETFPLFLLECFQAGLPVIATRIGEIPQLFESINGCTPGQLVDLKGEAPDANQLAASVVELVGNETKYRSMKDAAAVITKKYNMVELAKFYAATCSKLLPSCAG